MATAKPLSERDNLTNLGTQLQRRDRLRAQPAQQQAQRDLHQLMVDRRISVAELQTAMREDDLVGAYRRLAAGGVPDAQAQAQRAAEAERRERWERWQAQLSPDNPRSRFMDAGVGAARREKLREQYAGVDEPPEWFA